jgi:Uma2 family endonuclease
MPAHSRHAHAASPATCPLTADDLDSLPDGGRFYGIVDGATTYLKEPDARHGFYTFRLLQRLGSYIEAHQLGFIGPEIHVVLNPERTTVLVPDIAFFQSDRMPRPLPRGYIYLVPDLVVEMLSPGNSRRIMAEKVGLYLEAGVPLVWVVDHERRMVVAHRPGAKPVTLCEGDTLSGDDVVPGFRTPVAKLFDLGI